MSAARRGTAFAAAALLGLLGACSSPELVCTYETFELCQSAGDAALEAVDDAGSVTRVTIKPPDGTWRRDGADYLALAMVQTADGEVTVVRVEQVGHEPMRASVIPTD